VNWGSKKIWGPVPSLLPLLTYGPAGSDPTPDSKQTLKFCSKLLILRGL
jgi:hypothetical protein